MGTTSLIRFLINSVTVSVYSSILFSEATRNIYPSPRDQNNPEVWILIGQTNSPKHGYFLFEFLPIGREKQNGVVVRFAERMTGDGLVGIPEVGVTAVECISSASTTVNVLIELW